MDVFLILMKLGSRGSPGQTSKLKEYSQGPISRVLTTTFWV